MSSHKTRTGRSIGVGILLALFVGNCIHAISKPDTEQVVTASRAPEPYAQGIVCKQFDVQASIDGSTLNVALETDLPPDTNILLSASREYREVGDPELYAMDYIDEAGTIADWRSPRTFDVSNKIATRRFEKYRETLAGLDMAGKIAFFSNELVVRVVVPARQSNPNFGERNAKLAGTCPIETVGSAKFITWETALNYALSKRPATPRRVSYENLVKRKTYQLSRSTPLGPHHSPRNPESAIAAMKWIPEGGTIKVRKSHMKGATKWYKVRAKRSDGTSLGTGWVNSTALIGQTIERVD